MVDGPDRALRNRAPGSHRNTARQAMDGLWTGAWAAKTVKRPRQQPAHPQYANYWAPLTRKQHTMPHSAQPQHTNYWAPRTRKQHQQEHRLQRPTESSGPTQHAKGRTGDCPGPCKGATTRRNVTQVGGGGGALYPPLLHRGRQPLHRAQSSTKFNGINSDVCVQGEFAAEGFGQVTTTHQKQTLGICACTWTH